MRVWKEYVSDRDGGSIKATGMAILYGVAIPNQHKYSRKIILWTNLRHECLGLIHVNNRRASV